MISNHNHYTSVCSSIQKHTNDTDNDNVNVNENVNENDIVNVNVNVNVTEKLAPQAAMKTQFFIGKNLETGELFAEEHGKYVKGQMKIDDYVSGTASIRLYRSHFKYEEDFENILKFLNFLDDNENLCYTV